MEKDTTPSWDFVLSADVKYNKNITAAAKLFYMEIRNLCRKQEDDIYYCWGGNTFFAKRLNTEIRTIQRWLKELSYAKVIWESFDHADIDKERSNFHRKIFTDHNQYLVYKKKIKQKRCTIKYAERQK
jgi:hypothetical protein